MACGVSAALARAGERGGQFFRFGAVGVLNTGVDVAVYALGLAAGLSPAFANIAAFTVTNVFSYVVNAHVTFRRDGAPAPMSLKGYGAFWAAHLASLAISTAIVFFLAGRIGPFAAKAVAIALTVFINFAASAFFVFKPPRQR